MARTATTSVSRERITIIKKYPWPEQYLNFWNITMLAAGGLFIGVFASFMTIQSRMGLGTPWLFPYGVTVGSLTVLFVVIGLILAAQNNLQPGWVMLGCFILIALFLTGLIETGIQLFGNGNVNSYCNKYVSNNNIKGISIDTLAWLEQNSICQQWDAVFAFWIIGLIWLVWMMVMASQMAHLNSKHTSTTRRWSYFVPLYPRHTHSHPSTRNYSNCRYSSRRHEVCQHESCACTTTHPSPCENCVERGWRSHSGTYSGDHCGTQPDNDTRERERGDHDLVTRGGRIDSGGRGDTVKGKGEGKRDGKRGTSRPNGKGNVKELAKGERREAWWWRA